MSSSTFDSDYAEISQFFGCYLLVSVNENPRIRGRTYIGFTVDPNRRIRQHNAGKDGGGARRTSKRGPWDMVVIVHGFPNNISALRFEWAWQHPNRSRRLKATGLKKSVKETQLQFRIRILSHMLRTGPWARLPLTVRWLKEEYQMDFPPDLTPPETIRILLGPVTNTTHQPCDSSRSIENTESRCHLCSLTVDMLDAMQCLREPCAARFHMLCLAYHFLRNDTSYLLPVRGHCPKCSAVMTWVDAVQCLHNTIRYAQIEDTVNFAISSQTSLP